MAKDEQQPIIVKKIKKGGGGHHGGAWKVAYADFVTAMMAFFLLLWLLNVTTEEQKNAISNYFDPTSPKISEATSGAGGVLGGLSMAKEGAMTTNLQTISANNATPVPPPSRQSKDKTDSHDGAEGEDAEEKARREALRAEEDQRFQEAADALKQAIESLPEMAELVKNIMVDMTPEGLRIQIVDQKGQSMFPSGSARMYQKTEKLIGTIAKVVEKLPNDISVRGHTDSVKYSAGASYTNWELSADRANASRRVMEGAGLVRGRVANVVGKADTDPLIKDKPTDPRNRRISIILLREELTKGAAGVLEGQDGKPGASATGSTPSRLPTYQRTKGAVEFP